MYDILSKTVTTEYGLFEFHSFDIYRKSTLSSVLWDCPVCKSNKNKKMSSFRSIKNIHKKHDRSY